MPELRKLVPAYIYISPRNISTYEHPFNLLHHPDELDGVALRFTAGRAVAFNLLHLSDEPGGVG